MSFFLFRTPVLSTIRKPQAFLNNLSNSFLHELINFNVLIDTARRVVLIGVELVRGHSGVQ